MHNAPPIVGLPVIPAAHINAAVPGAYAPEAETLQQEPVTVLSALRGGETGRKLVAVVLGFALVFGLAVML